MINVATARLLVDYKHWADLRLFDSLSSLAPGEVSKERASAFKSIIGTLNHIYVVDCIWQAHLQGRGHGFKTSHDLLHAELLDLRLAQNHIDRWYCDWSARQTDASLLQPIEFTSVSGERGTMSAGAMLMHVANHANYHRGWVVQMYFEIPASPPVTDLPVYLREQGPSVKPLNTPNRAPTYMGLFASATNLLPYRYR